MSTIQSTYSSFLSVAESSADPFVDSGNPSMTFSGTSSGGVLNATSSPTATMHASGRIALSSGTATLNLTAVVNGDGVTKDFTGLRIQVCKFANPATNANSITLTFGASTPYLLLGAAWKIILLPGQSVLLYLAGSAPVVSGSLKNIDLAGTGAQALDFHLVGGA